MDKQTFEYVNNKFMEMVSEIEKRPAAFVGECSLILVAEEIRNIIKAIQYAFGVELDFEKRFKEFVSEHYQKHYLIGEKYWSDKSWDEIISFFHIIKENAVLQFFSLFHDFSAFEKTQNIKNWDNKKLFEAFGMKFEAGGKKVIKEYIDNSEKEPLRYLNDISLKKFYSSLAALEYVIYVFIGEGCFDVFDYFLPYVCLFYSEKYSIKDKTFFGARNVESVISFFSKDDKEAFYTFFELYRKFNSEKMKKDYKKIWEEKYSSDLRFFFGEKFS